ncbi:hypothetical protein PQX77_021441 [Marasmius sp. AFHP31]|nr:hypothetical protein PQX77_021441 [Marasmius sp. AFHP31]
MSFLHSAGNTNIGGGIFNLVNGTQNNHYYSQSSSESRSVRIQPGEEWKEIPYQEYERIKLGRIKLLRTLHHEGAWHMSDFQLDDWHEAERVIEVVSIAAPNGTDESNPLLAVKYTGQNSYKYFKEDIIRFSRQRMTTMAQLRAFNDSRLIPVIIFNEELVSVKRFLQHNRYTVQARCYLHFHAMMWGASPDASGNEIWISLMKSFQIPSLDRLWFRPQTGALCFGPPGPTIYDHRSPITYPNLPYVAYPSGRSLYLELPPLPLNASHNDTILLNYIICNVPEWLVVLQVSFSYRHYDNGPVHRGIRLWREQLMTNRWTTRQGSVLKRVLEIPFHQWTHNGPYRIESHWNDTPPTTERRETRFAAITGYSDIRFKFMEDRIPSRQQRWLTQAGWVFSCLGIPQEDWASCGIVTGIILQLASEGREQSYWLEDPDEDFNPPCYLFVLPPPQLSDGVPDIETWLRGENLYYYSYDPEGGSSITEQERISLGLPSFMSEFHVVYAYWDAEAYDFMEKWQRAKGFDYGTIDYAKSLGLPIFEVIPRNSQTLFEDLTESPDVLVMDIDSSLDNQMDFTPTAGTDHDFSSSDMDTDVDN